MNKFAKRLKKSTSRHDNALVIGTGFGQLADILPLYNTVFVIDETRPVIKAKNLVYRETCDRLEQFVEISVIIIDLSKVSLLESLKDVWQRNESAVVIEGNDAIGREFSKPLYNTNWNCYQLQGSFHVWEKIK